MEKEPGSISDEQNKIRIKKKSSRENNIGLENAALEEIGPVISLLEAAKLVGYDLYRESSVDISVLIEARSRLQRELDLREKYNNTSFVNSRMKQLAAHLNRNLRELEAAYLVDVDLIVFMDEERSSASDAEIVLFNKAYTFLTSLYPQRGINKLEREIDIRADDGINLDDISALGIPPPVTVDDAGFTSQGVVEWINIPDENVSTLKDPL
jgi:hypothetical protein